MCKASRATRSARYIAARGLGTLSPVPKILVSWLISLSQSAAIVLYCGNKVAGTFLVEQTEGVDLSPLGRDRAGNHICRCPTTDVDFRCCYHVET